MELCTRRFFIAVDELGREKTKKEKRGMENSETFIAASGT